MSLPILAHDPLTPQPYVCRHDSAIDDVAMREALSDLVGRETRAAINALRGRID